MDIVGGAGRDDVALFLDPASHHFERDRLFDIKTGQLGGDDVLAPYVYLKRWLAERGVRVHTADMLENGVGLAARNVYASLGTRHRYPRLAARADVIPSAFLAMECPVVEPRLYQGLFAASRVFRRMLSYSTSEALAPFLTGPVNFQRFRIPQSFESVHEPIWSAGDRRFLLMINGNKRPRVQAGELYTDRLRAVEAFGRYGEIDLYGVGWDGPPYRVGQTRVPSALRRLHRIAETAWWRVRPHPLQASARRAWRGALDAKAATLGQYRFAICFENMVLEGWITEKLFDCLFTGTVPIYLGAPDIEHWVPDECFIDMRRFSDFSELRAFLHDLSPQQISDYREAGRAFIESERFVPFSKRAFAELFGRLIEVDAGVRLERTGEIAART